jgi:hypothetical protein
VDTDSLVGASTFGSTSREWLQWSDDPGRVVARFSTAAAASAALCLMLWAMVPRSLSGEIDIVGYPTFANYDHRPAFWAYRLVVYAFPLLLITFYAIIARLGPLRRRPRPTSTGSIRMLEPPSIRRPPDPSSFRFGVIPRLALPLAVVVTAAGTRTGQTRGFAAMCGLVYLLAILAVGVLSSFAASRGESRTGKAAFWDGVALANGAGGAAAALLGLWFVSRYTVVFAQGTGRSWPWMPLWLAALGASAALSWTVHQMRRGRPAWTTERTLLIVVVGSVALFLAISVLPPPVTSFEGFDDAQEMAAANALSQGLFPWRDFLFIHGLFPDVLRGSLSMAAFGDTVWGVLAGSTVLITPLCWVLLYLYAVWVSRGNAWFLAVVAIGAVGGVFPPLDTRFILVPVALVLLGETLRRQRPIWCVGLVLLLFVQAVIVPETSFLAVPALTSVAAADALHRERGVGILKAMRRTAWCVATGGVAMLLFASFLAWHGALRSFIDYYVVFGPGHNEAGAIPPTGITTREYVLWTAGILAVLLTIWATAWRIRRRGPWEPQHWVALAAAGFAVLYQEKALGRFDKPHVWQVFTVALPLILLWLWKLLPAVDVVVGWSPSVSRRSTASAANATASLVLVCFVVFANPLVPIFRGVDTQHRIVVAESAASYPRLGYAAPGAVDTTLLRDLDVALRAYADDKPVFDMTNSLGYIQYLLRRDPGTRFLHVSMAIPPYAQRLLIDELERSRPPVVIFDSVNIGLPSWDGISNNVRHYQVSEYILDGWLPVMRTHGNLLLVRRDLLQRGLSMPALLEPPLTTGLWFSGPSCSWGASPNFLRSVPQGESITLPVRSLGRRVVVDIAGWAADSTTGRPARAVVVVSGQKAIASLTPSLERADVAQALGTASSASGFRYLGVVSEGESLSVYMLAEDGKLHPLNGPTTSGAVSVELPNGRVVPTAESTGGYVDEFRTSVRMIGKVEVPKGLNLAHYDLATMSTGREPIGKASVVITDAIGEGDHYISAVSLPESGPDLAVRVGSCLQWQGYDSSKPLYVSQDGGVPVTTVTMSGVRD